jgi:hypothetical protein
MGLKTTIVLFANNIVQATPTGPISFEYLSILRRYSGEISTLSFEWTSIAPKKPQATVLKRIFF